MFVFQNGVWIEYDVCNIEPGDMGECDELKKTMLFFLGAQLGTEFGFKTKTIRLWNY